MGIRFLSNASQAVESGAWPEPGLEMNRQPGPFPETNLFLQEPGRRPGVPVP